MGKATKLVNRFLSPMGVHLARTRKPDAPGTEPNWAEERAYWYEVLREDYRRHYDLDLHPRQSDDAIVPTPELVNAIQTPYMALPDAFFASGYRNIREYHELLRDHGMDVRRMERILELGVGLGRLIVHFFPFSAELYGCDVTPDVLEHTKRTLGGRVKLELTDLDPPLPYPDEHFDFVYANSVFTHTPCRKAGAWAAELDRIIRPGGCLVFSVFDASERFGKMSYREFDREWARKGCRDWAHEKGVLMLTWYSRRFLVDVWSRHFTDLELRTVYRDQSLFFGRKASGTEGER